ncbi:MAG: hypothetical protein KAH25_09520, partial [Bacteroidales bacterium]|nr:hypothetical protein [Bacteroidales bacterium]
FGFTWFELNLVKIERQCFFGDICVADLGLYVQSVYVDQQEGLQVDMPIIMRIDVYKNDKPDPIRSFNNMATLGEGDCMEVYWANDEDLEEEFTFMLYGWLPDMYGAFDWRFVNTWTFLDDDCPATNVPDFLTDDGVVDFYVGDCWLTQPDYAFPPWIY